MSKSSADKFPVGSVVVFNHLPDATVYDVVSTVGAFGRVVREHARPGYATQIMDVSYAKEPTEEQLKNHRLVVLASQPTERELNYLWGV